MVVRAIGLKRVVAVPAGELVLIAVEIKLVVAVVAEGLEEISSRSDVVGTRRSIVDAG